MTPEMLLNRYQVDVSHARHVADQALILFDRAREVHGLSPRKRRLLELGALLHNVGLNVDQPTHHLVGRDIVLEETLLSKNERAVVACLVAFHRKKVRPEQEPTFLSLGKKDQQDVLRLAALLRIADGLDYSATQGTHIQDCEISKKSVLVKIAGTSSDEDGARAEKKADLWHKVLPYQFTIAAVKVDMDGAEAAAVTPTREHAADVAANGTGDGDSPDGDRSDLTNRATITSHDVLSEAGRRLLRGVFQKFLAEEPGVRKGKDIEAVHQMRVATRRLRAMLQLLESAAPRKQVRYFRAELKQVAQALSPVRDCDVFLEQIAHYVETLPAEQHADIDVLTSALQRDREAGRARLLEYLKSERYTDFKRDFAAFVTETAKGWDTTLRVRDVVGSTLWSRYEQLRMHETAVAIDSGDHTQITHQQEEALHEARISGKRLRYVLDTFADALDPRADRCVKPLKALQDHLGDLQDIAVATAYVRELQDRADADTRPALDAYLASREEERARLLASVPGVWQRVMGETYRRDLVRLLVNL